MNSMRSWISTHPNLSAWFALALGMVAILVYEARDVGLEPRQWFWLIVITVLVAGACIWIISWGDTAPLTDDSEDDAQVAPQNALEEEE